MWSNILDKISFRFLFFVVVLMPVFAFPFTSIPTEISKGLLLVIGLSLSIIFWAVARFSDGKIVIPKSRLLISALGVVVVILLSALFSSASGVSLFGTMFDVGTFWVFFAAFLLMLFSSIIFKDSHDARNVLLSSAISAGAVLVFQLLRFFLPHILSFGILGAKTENLLGSWNALGLFAGMSLLASLLVTEFFSISKRARWCFVSLILLSLVLVACVNFILIWELVGIYCLIIFVYKLSSNFNKLEDKEVKNNFPIVSFAVLMVAILFFVSSRTPAFNIGEVLPHYLGLSSTEVNPSFTATMSFTKQSFLKNYGLGIGPNHFNELWAMYKPEAVNNTQFWDVSFNSGSGLFPSLIATTGAFGVISLGMFFAMFLLAGVKYIFLSRGGAMSSEGNAFFALALYLFVAGFLYSIGIVMLLLAFAFTGIFIGLSLAGKQNGEIVISFFDNRRKSFLITFSLIILMVASLLLSFKYLQRFSSISYYNKAVLVKDIPTAEASIGKALSLYRNDLYLRTFAQIYLIKLNSLVAKGSSLTDNEKADLQKSFDQAKNGALLAILYNNQNYLNFQMLGTVYRAVGSYGVAGAYDQAIDAYNRASALNPLNPGLKLAIGQAYFSNNKLSNAKTFINEALALKPDYIDALIALSQIAKSEGDTKNAISYAEKALALAPDNKDLKNYWNSLKNGTSSVSATPSTSKSSTDKKSNNKN